MISYPKRRGSTALRQWISFGTGILLALFCNEALRAHAQDTKGIIPQSCSELYHLFSSVQNDAQEWAKTQARNVGRVIKWKAVIRSTSETLWGMEVLAECLPAGSPAKVSILFDGKYRSSLERLPTGSQLNVKAILNGFEQNRGLLLTDAELLPEERTAPQAEPGPKAPPPPPLIQEKPTTSRSEQPAATPSASQNQTSPPGQSLPDKEIRAFLRNLLDICEQSDWKSIPLFYDDRVDYYGAGTVDIKTIQKDRQGFYKRWKQSRYTIGDVEVTEDHGNEGLISVRYIYDFESSSSREAVRGKAENFLKLRRVGRGFRIVSEKQKLLHRERM